jgi:hypothetical protein
MRIVALPQLKLEKFTDYFTFYLNVTVSKMTGFELGNQVSNPGRRD